MALTPMMRQYFSFKDKCRDAILFFRLGDFYEMFYDDAKLVSKELELTLTGKDCGESERAPMCGIPYHSADPYIARLVMRGYKVAVCEQVEDPATAKGLVKRDIVRLITPGTVTDGSMLTENKNNFICAVCAEGDEIGAAFADISTGEMSATVFSGTHAQMRLINELGTYKPSELLINTKLDDFPKIKEYIKTRLNAVVNENQSERFDFNAARELLQNRFPDSSSGDGGEERPAIISAVGALLNYIAETQINNIPYIKSLNIYADGQYLEIDLNTRRNLELTETMRQMEKKGSLLSVLDRTRSAMGARLLRRWLEFPLVNMNAIIKRQGAVEELHGSFMLREELADLLRGVLDLERLMTRVTCGTANARDLRAIAATISLIPQVRGLIAESESAEMRSLYERLDELGDIYAAIDAAIVDEPPFSLREGGIIREGFNADADKLRSVMNGGKDIIEQIEAEEREKTGIKNLRVGYNRVFGYYIEVTKSFLHLVPDSYVRRQTLTNAERYITDKLKQHETAVLGASDKLFALEYELFRTLSDSVAAEVGRIRRSADALALLDVYVSLADVAARNNYVKPDIDYGDAIKIKDGRHPVVEHFSPENYFVPNDVLLDTKSNRLLLITGPNMAGKSTYMRQTALICIMAQMGSFVPAKEAELGIIDKLFTRVGASDDLAAGQSTFMLEMTEVAYILANATKRSLIIYDEIGRGTSTFDGMSIARAIAEYTLGRKIGAKTMFATHYHELTELEECFEGVVNYNIAAKKRGDEVTFLRKIIRGAADDSYGIEVAKLAGVPGEVIRRAKEILRGLEEQAGAPANTRAAKAPEPAEGANYTLDDIKAREAAEKIKSVDTDVISPIEALNILYDLKQQLKQL